MTIPVLLQNPPVHRLDLTGVKTKLSETKVRTNDNRTKDCARGEVLVNG
jgi:hypothetical protein